MIDERLKRPMTVTMPASYFYAILTKVCDLPIPEDLKADFANGTRIALAALREIQRAEPRQPPKLRVFTGGRFDETDRADEE